MNRWNPDLYDGAHGFVAKLGAPLIELLGDVQGKRVLDVGCGTGTLTAQIAELGAETLGIDASPAMIERAREQFPDLDFRIADATAFEVEGPFDALFSNAALHWVKPPEAAVACMAGALKPGGWFVIEMGGHGNVQTIERATLDELEARTGRRPESPWFFPGIPEYGGMLEAHGIEVVQAWLFDRPTPLEGEEGLRNWLRMFASATLGGVPGSMSDEVLAAIEARCRPTLWDGDRWTADYRRLRLVGRRR